MSYLYVWQYQNIGARYSSDALYAQAFVDDEYSWEAEVNRGNENWADFNKEDNQYVWWADMARFQGWKRK